MIEANKPKLGGIVEMDETYAGGRAHGKRRRNARNKEVVIGIRQRQGELRFFHAEDMRSGTLEKYVRENVSEDVDILMTESRAVSWCDTANLEGNARSRAQIHRSQHRPVRKR